MPLRPVIVNEGGLRSIGHGELVLRRLSPVDVIYTVGAVIVVGDDDTTNQLLGAFILKTLPALLVNNIPEIRVRNS